MRAHFYDSMDTIIAAAQREGINRDLSYETFGNQTISIGSTHTIMRLIGALANDGNNSLMVVDGSF